ncbi:MAG: N-formylglutamate amidohydrolase, partial [Alphaproteobacteria bacterium]|nr:N-formylglutamate amidohydrolase [Alphaproteobacteria bacterium]
MRRAIPGVLFRHDPVVDALPLVFDSPHSGTNYPTDFGFTAPHYVVRTSEDTYVDELYGAAPDHGATLIGALFPRAYIDPNRHLADIDASLIDGTWPEPLMPGEKTKLGLGLIWRLAKPDTPMYDRKLSVDEVMRRINRYYRPYHETLDDAVDRLHRRFGAVWHVNCHSMKSIGNRMAPDAGKKRPDFVLGDRDGTTCEAEFTHLVGEALSAMGYSVAHNDPYKGVELVRKHGRPREGRHSLQIEINRGRVINERTHEKTPEFEKVVADLGRLTGIIAEFVRRRCALTGCDPAKRSITARTVPSGCAHPIFDPDR